MPAFYSRLHFFLGQHIFMSAFAIFSEVFDSCSESFPEAVSAIAAAVAEAQQVRTGSSAPSSEWEIEYYFVALEACLVPLGEICSEVAKAAIYTFRQLWPDREPPKQFAALAHSLHMSGDRLDDWRGSAARAGADKLLEFIVSWYETLNLDSFKTLRIRSAQLSDPARVSKRKDTAYLLASYANTSVFIPDPEGSIEDYGDDDDDDDDDVDLDEIIDEVIEMEPAPSSAPAGDG
jgi:hypothetical protein